MFLRNKGWLVFDNVKMFSLLFRKVFFALNGCRIGSLQRWFKLLRLKVLLFSLHSLLSIILKKMDVCRLKIHCRLKMDVFTCLVLYCGCTEEKAVVLRTLWTLAIFSRSLVLFVEQIDRCFILFVRVIIVGNWIIGDIFADVGIWHLTFDGQMLIVSVEFFGFPPLLCFVR